jgi:protein TonB
VPVIAKDKDVPVPKDEPIKAAVNPNAIPGDETKPGEGDALIKVPGDDISGPSIITKPAVPPAPEKAVGYASEMPSFNGDIKDYLRRNLRYPEMARTNGVEGRVYVQFTVETDGSVTDVNLKRGAQRSLDEEALRVIRSMPRWKPGKNNGRAVRVFLTLPIYFQLQ